MEVGTFWQHQELVDILLLVVAFSLILLLPLLGLFSVFKNFLLTERRATQNAEDFSLLLERFMTPRIFSLLVFLLNSLLFSSLLLFIFLKYDYFSWEMTTSEGLGLLLLLYVLFSIVIIWRRLSFRVWSALFMPKQVEILLLRDYSLIAYIRAIALLGLYILALSPIDRNIVLTVFSLGLCSFVILRLIDTLRVLAIDFRLCFSVFLYLCTCELLPWVYILLLAEHIYRYNYLVLLFEYL